MLYAVKNVKYQKKYRLCFIMVLLMIIVLLLKSWLKNFTTNLSVRLKIQKNILHLVFLLKRRVMMVNQLCIKNLIGSFRFVSTSLFSLVDSLSDGLYNIKCKDCNSFLDYMNFYDDKLVYTCFDCKTNYNINFNNKLIDGFSNTYNFCSDDINK